MHLILYQTSGTQPKTIIITKKESHEEYFREGEEEYCKGGKPLQHNGIATKEGVVREAWLRYFNDYLRAHAIITEDEWRKMRRLIG